MSVDRFAFGGAGISIYILGSFAGADSDITIGNQSLDIYVSGYYSLYQITINIASKYNEIATSPDDTGYTKCNITCTDNSPKLFYTCICLNEYKNSPNCSASININNCTNVTYETAVSDSVTMAMVNELQAIDQVISKSVSECGNNSNHQNFDIGYPLMVDEDIININYYGMICCRGYKSCYRAASMVTSVGHVLWIAQESCYDTLIWNSDDTDPNSQIPVVIQNEANVYCLATQSCVSSVIKTSSNVYCLSPESCKDTGTVILEGLAVFCTMNACLDGKISINSTSHVYLIDIQGVTVLVVVLNR